jgi:hypothetical protein
MAVENNQSGFILGIIKAETDVHISIPRSYPPLTRDASTLHPAGDKVRFERRHSWIAPLCVFLSLLLPLVAADFKPFIFEPSIWRIIFIILATAAFSWLSISIYCSANNVSVGQLLAKIKSGVKHKAGYEVSK